MMKRTGPVIGCPDYFRDPPGPPRLEIQWLQTAPACCAFSILAHRCKKGLDIRFNNNVKRAATSQDLAGGLFESFMTISPAARYRLF